MENFSKRRTKKINNNMQKVNKESKLMKNKETSFELDTKKQNKKLTYAFQTKTKICFPFENSLKTLTGQRSATKLQNYTERN